MIRSLIHDTVNGVVALPGRAIRFVLSEALTYLTEEIDLTGVLLRGIDLDRMVATLDVDGLLARIDLNRVLAGVDLDALLTSLDLNAVLDSIDLQRVVARLDLNALLADLDLNALLAPLDLDAVLARVDVQAVIDDVDVSSIVRGASTTVTTEMISDVRSGSERADDAVENLVDRVLRRKRRDSQEGRDDQED